MAKFTISALEKAVMANIKSFGANKAIPQNMLASVNQNIKPNQVSAVINNMIGKGLVVRERDMFGPVVKLTHSGKIRATKLSCTAMAA